MSSGEFKSTEGYPDHPYAHENENESDGEFINYRPGRLTAPYFELCARFETERIARAEDARKRLLVEMGQVRR